MNLPDSLIFFFLFLQATPNFGPAEVEIVQGREGSRISIERAMLTVRPVEKTSRFQVNFDFLDAEKQVQRSITIEPDRITAKVLEEAKEVELTSSKSYLLGSLWSYDDFRGIALQAAAKEIERVQTDGWVCDRKTYDVKDGSYRKLTFYWDIHNKVLRKVRFYKEGGLPVKNLIFQDYAVSADGRMLPRFVRLQRNLSKDVTIIDFRPKDREKEKKP